MPLHHQIKVAVLQGIEQGWLRPGEQLPRERQLAEALGVSLAPVRQAMVDLTKEGYVDRTRGKGTFVRERKLVEKIQILGSFHASMERQGLHPEVTVLEHRSSPRPEEVAAALSLRGRSRLVPAPAGHARRHPARAAHRLAAGPLRARHGGARPRHRLAVRRARGGARHRDDLGRQPGRGRAGPAWTTPSCSVSHRDRRSCASSASPAARPARRWSTPTCSTAPSSSGSPSRAAAPSRPRPDPTSTPARPCTTWRRNG